MFPGAGAQVYYNEAGEPLGWDYPSDDPSDLDAFYDEDYWYGHELDDEEVDWIIELGSES